MRLRAVDGILEGAERSKRHTMTWQERVIIDPDVLVGKPVIKGTRLAVEFILELLAEGWSHEQILHNYPQLTEDDILAAIHYATEILKVERIYSVSHR